MAIARGEITITELYDGDNFYRAWADTPDGSGSSFTTEESDRAYLGVYSGREEPTDYSQYKWSRILGESAITAILSNDSHQIGTDENGNNQNYTGAKTTVAVFQGGENDTSNWKIDSIQVEPAGAVTGEIIDTYTYKVKSMTEDEASVTFTLKHKDNQYSPLEKTFTLSKNKQGIKGDKGETGESGKDAKLLYLTSTLETMSFDANEVASPTAQTATIEAKLQNTSGSISFSAKAYNGTSALSNSIALNGSGNSRTFSVSSFPSNATHVSITATLGNLTDTVSIFKLRHGKEGAGGAPGQNAIVGYLTNESITLGANSSGVVGSFTPATGTFRMFDGTTEVTASANTTYALEKSNGLTASINSSTGVYSITAMSANTATAEFKATYNGVSIFKTVTLSKSIAGEKGEKGDPGLRGLQGLEGPEGKQGIPGKEGKDGVSSYTHIAYATGDQGQSFNEETFPQATYIGMYVSPDQDSSGSWEDYEWTLIKGSRGEQGLPGKEGADGKTPYFHTAWANNSTGTDGFSRTVSSNKLYIGTYTSYDSNPPAAGTYNWVKIKGEKGDKGDSAISAVLTNESITFAADKDGEVQNYVGNTGSFLLMEGTVNKSAETKFEKVNQTNVSAAIDKDGFYTISAMTKGTSVTTGQATFSATYNGTTINKTVTISKSIAGQTGGKGDPGAPGGKGDPGAPGAPATSYWLTSSVDTITVKYNGDYDPKTITYYGHSKTGSNNTQNYAGRFIIQTSIDGVNFTQAYLSPTNMNKVDFSVPEDVLFIKAKFYQAGGTTYLLDEQTTPVLHSADGLKGVGLEDKDYQVGTEVFTDKADDSVVYIDIDGKSYQHAGSGENLAPHPKNWEYYSGASYNEITGEIIIPIGSSNLQFWIRWDGNRAPVRLSFDTVTGGGFLWNTTYFAEDRNTQVLNVGGVHSANGMVPNWTSNPQRKSHDSPIIDDNVKWVLMRFSGNSSYTPSEVRIKNLKVSSSNEIEYEPPTLTPEYPIEIHSLNDFDVVSSVGRRNLASKDGWYAGAGVNPVKTDNGFIITRPEVGSSSDVRVRGIDLDIKEETDYTLSFKVRKLDGELLRIGGHVSPNFTSAGNIYVNGEEVLGNYVVSPTYELLDNGEWYEVVAPLRTGESVSETGLLYIQPNRSSYRYSVVEIKDIKLEEGHLATPYAPPLDEAEDTNHPLINKINLSLSEPLKSVGDVKDRLFRDSDGLWKVERNIGEVVLDGTENWTQGSDNMTDVFRYYSGSISLGVESRNADIGTCSHLKTNLYTTQNQEGAVFGMSNRYPYLYLNKTKYPTTASVKDWVLNENTKGTPVVLQFRLETSTIQTLDQEFQDKLNNLRSFQDSNYVYTIINDKTDIMSERLKPTLRSTFKGGGYYARWKAAHDLEKTTEYIEQEIKRTQNTAWIRAGMRVGYSSFTQTNPNSVYICGLEYRDGYRDMVLVDKPAEIYIRESNETAFIPNQALTVSGIPSGTTAYIVWDNTKKSLYLAYFESVMTETGVSKKRWRNISGQTIEFTDSLFAIGEIEV